MITLILTSPFNEQKYKNYISTQISKLFQYPHPSNPSGTNRDSILRNTKKKSLHQHSKLKTPFTRLKHQKLKTFNSNQKKINRTAMKPHENLRAIRLTTGRFVLVPMFVFIAQPTLCTHDGRLYRIRAIIEAYIMQL